MLQKVRETTCEYRERYTFFVNIHTEICKANLTEEGLSEEEMNNEMAVLRVQKAVVLQMQAKEEEALKLYTDALGHKYVDKKS